MKIRKINIGSGNQQFLLNLFSKSVNATATHSTNSPYTIHCASCRSKIKIPVERNTMISVL